MQSVRELFWPNWLQKTFFNISTIFPTRWWMVIFTPENWHNPSDHVPNLSQIPHNLRVLLSFLSKFWYTLLCGLGPNMGRHRPNYLYLFTSVIRDHVPNLSQISHNFRVISQLLKKMNRKGYCESPSLYKSRVVLVKFVSTTFSMWEFNVH